MYDRSSDAYERDSQKKLAAVPAMMEAAGMSPDHQGSFENFKSRNKTKGSQRTGEEPCLKWVCILTVIRFAP